MEEFNSDLEPSPPPAPTEVQHAPLNSLSFKHATTNHVEWRVCWVIGVCGRIVTLNADQETKTGSELSSYHRRLVVDHAQPPTKLFHATHPLVRLIVLFLHGAIGAHALSIAEMELNCVRGL